MATIIGINSIIVISDLLFIIAHLKTLLDISYVSTCLSVEVCGVCTSRAGKCAFSLCFDCHAIVGFDDIPIDMPDA